MMGIHKVDGYIITIENDTIFCQIQILSNTFNKYDINPLYYTKRIVTFQDKGIEIRYKPFEIKSFTLTPGDIIRHEIQYASLIVNGKNCFVRVIDIGAINVYEFARSSSVAPYSTLYVLKVPDKESLVVTNPGYKLKVLKYLDNLEYFQKGFEDERQSINTLPSLVKYYNEEQRKE